MKARLTRIFALWSTLLFAGLLLAGLFPGAAASGAASGPPAGYIVVLQEGVGPEDVAQAHGLAATNVYRHALNGFAAPVPAQAIRGLQSDPRVLFVAPDLAYELDVQTTPTGINRSERDLNTFDPIDGTTSVVNYDVAMIDTGIDGSHPDLNVAGGRNFTGGNTSAWGDKNGHGTHTAGTVAARDNGVGVVGVVPGARLWALKVCTSLCFTSAMIAAMDWIIARKAEAIDGAADGDPGIDFAVASMSISTGNDDGNCGLTSGDPLHTAVCNLVNAGVPLALSAGNNAVLKNLYPQAIGVSALADFNGRAGGGAAATCRSDVDDTRANFSNWGPKVDIMAPGVCINSTWKGGGYKVISGTSMAAPHVAGAVVLYLQSNSLSPATSAAGANALRDAIVNAAIAKTHACGYSNDSASQSTEPLLFVNAGVFGGTGQCTIANGSLVSVP
ncbi:MAG: S8 family serine peptidase [Chloroflexi bacterium]|nr:S8 family serine peptidase [Chloroflexota bacterium]